MAPSDSESALSSSTTAGIAISLVFVGLILLAAVCYARAKSRNRDDRGPSAPKFGDTAVIAVNNAGFNAGFAQMAPRPVQNVVGLGGGDGGNRESVVDVEDYLVPSALMYGVPQDLNSGPAPLPEHWVATEDGSGDTYYYNSVTSETSWKWPAPPPACARAGASEHNNLYEAVYAVPGGPDYDPATLHPDYAVPDDPDGPAMVSNAGHAATGYNDAAMYAELGPAQPSTNPAAAAGDAMYEAPAAGAYEVPSAGAQRYPAVGPHATTDRLYEYADTESFAKSANGDD